MNTVELRFITRMATVGGRRQRVYLLTVNGVALSTGAAKPSFAKLTQFINASLALVDSDVEEGMICTNVHGEEPPKEPT